jgi:acetyl/propionyl-CoA carboxylase alpha subunit
MPGTFTCRHCGKTLPRNPRLKKSQKYCSALTCQQARKNAWGRNEYSYNKAHRKKRLESQKACYAKRPGHAYQATYREKHPEYEQRNREQQQKRNKGRLKKGGSMIVNTDALSLQASIDGAYALIPVAKGEKIVNTDALVVQLRAMTGSQAFLPSNTG